MEKECKQCRQTKTKLVVIKLLADGKVVPGKDLVLNEANKWEGEFTDLAVYKDGKEIKYTVEEVEVKEYKSTVTGDMDQRLHSNQ